MELVISAPGSTGKEVVGKYCHQVYNNLSKFFLMY